MADSRCRRRHRRWIIDNHRGSGRLGAVAQKCRNSNRRGEYCGDNPTIPPRQLRRQLGKARLCFCLYRSHIALQHRYAPMHIWGFIIHFP